MTFRKVLLVQFMVVAIAGSARAAPSPASLPTYDLHFPGFYHGAHVSISGVHGSRFRAFSGPAERILAIGGHSDTYNSQGRSRGRSGWMFDVEKAQTTRVGLFFDDPQQHQSTVQFVNAKGQAVGYTMLGDSVPAPDSAWFYDPVTRQSRQIGLYETYEANDFPLAINNNGLVAGLWTSGTGGAPEYFWAYDPATNVSRQIGLVGGLSRSSDFHGLTPQGHIVGGSRSHSGQETGVLWQYDANTDMSTQLGFVGPSYPGEISRFHSMNDEGTVGGGTYAVWNVAAGTTSGFVGWVYDPVTRTTHKAGLTQPGDPNAVIIGDFVDYISPAGFALGASGNTSFVFAPWIYDQASGVTTRLGFHDSAHTLSNGGQVSEIELHDDAGRVVGTSRRAQGFFGQSAWLYEKSSGQTRQLGLLGPSYFAPNGAHETHVFAMNSQGQIIGATRNGGNQFGPIDYAAWMYDPATRVTTPLAERLATTATIGSNFPRAINNKGQVVGGSGRNWWLYDPEVPIDGTFISPRDAAHGEASLAFFNDAGFVAGHSERISGRGQSGWFFDPASRQTTLLVFSQSSGGQAFTSIRHLGDDGVVVGEYDLFDGNTLLGRRPFFWNETHGFHDLLDLVSQRSPQFEWDGFIMNLEHIDSRLIAGYGRLKDGNFVPFVLRLVPEPSAVLLTAMILMASILSRRGWRLCV